MTNVVHFTQYHEMIVSAARRFCRAYYSVIGLFYLKIYRQLTHTNAPPAASMHHAGVAVHLRYSAVGCGSSLCFQHVLTVVVVLKQPSLIIHTSRELLLQQSVLVDYCCFHLTSGASTALGSYIGHRNRRSLPSTLREEFVEKRYQVFDTIGVLLILSQVNFSSRGILAANHNNIGAASVCNTVRDVQKLLE